MVKKVQKKPAAKYIPPKELKDALREFILAHRKGYDEGSIRDLMIYIDAYHKIKLTRDQLDALLMEEMKSIAASKKAVEMEEELFTPKDRVDLGSVYCPRCSRFKDYQKECPHCGHHEMTV